MGRSHDVAAMLALLVSRLDADKADAPPRPHHAGRRRRHFLPLHACIAVRLSKLEKKGWRPRRTIIVYSWDAEEFVLVPDPDDRSHTLYDYMIRQNPPVEWPVGEQTLQLLSSTLEYLHLTSLMDYVSENVFDGA
ncbi:hypothetical protein ZWY2020_033900 [Hordeum vulgare]|nr:hypothetical protein ZWY2020_033900 [Hordeum vulgare]